MSSSGVVFDVDGTLVDTSYLHTLAWFRAFRDHGHQVEMARIHRLIGMASAGLVEKVIGKADDAIDDTYSDHYHAYADDDFGAFPDAGELLRTLARRGATVVLATSAKPEDVERLRNAIDADEAIAHVTDSGDAEDGKPAPDIFVTAMDEADIDRTAAVAVGDSVWDVEAAAAAGIPCIGLLCGGISRAELEEAGAVAIFDDPAHLLAELDRSPLARVVRSG